MCKKLSVPASHVSDSRSVTRRPERPPSVLPTSRVLWLVAFAVVWTMTGYGGIAVGQVAGVDDPSDMADSSGDIKRIEAWMDNGSLNLTMTVYGVFAPAAEDTPAGMTNRYYYHWLLDTDNNPATGYLNDEYEGNATNLETPIGVDLIVQFGWRDGATNGVYAYTLDPSTGDEVELFQDYEYTIAGDTMHAVIPLEDLDLEPGRTIAVSAFQEGASNGWQVDWIESSELMLEDTSPSAYNPDPADGAYYTDTWANLSWSPDQAAVSHDVYFGDNYDDVTKGTGGAARGNQIDTSYLVGFPGYPYPEGLVPGTTYYWRIDEIQADGTVYRGDVWSFTIPPRTAYNPSPADGAEFVDLDVELSWTPGHGAKLHTVYFGDNYDEVNNATDGTMRGQATFKPDSLEREKVYYWRVDEFDSTDTYKGEVWAFSTPGAVGNPNPANGATGVQMNAVLSWTPGESATSSDVYFGTDKDAVRSATTASIEYKGNKPLGSESYDPGKLGWHSVYYWRVDGIGANTNKGNVWSFETADFITVDDFESYNELAEDDPDSKRIYMTWIDGFEIPTNGSVVGYADLPLTEHNDVHSGGTSMPYSYDNDGRYSEANMTLDYPRDWTEEGVGVLSLWLKGNASNAAEPMYVILNETAAVYHDDPAAAQIDEWTRWTIDLQKFADQGLDLTNVDSIGIGFGDKNDVQAGGSGKMLFDDIALYRSPAAPMDPGLVARWMFDDDAGDTAADSSGNGHDGTAINGASISAGVLALNGSDQYVEVPHDPALNLTDAFTITAFVRLDAADDRRAIITKEQMPHSSRGWNCWIQDGEPRMQLMDGVKWAETGDVNQSKLTVQSGATLEAGVFYHLAFVYDSAGPEQIYVDGALQVSEDVVTGTLHANEQPVRIGAYVWDPAGYQKYLAGSIDELRIYNRVLTEAEITEVVHPQQP